MGGVIPLSDSSRRPRHFPIVTVGIIAANAIVFVLELTHGDAFVTKWSAIPAQITSGHGLITILTAMFMHGGWIHLIGNMWFLWIFGDNIEDYLGHFSYLMFYLVSGFAAMATHILLNAGSNVPALGASGAIAGVMGGYFVLYPRARVMMWFPPIFFF